MLEAIIKQFNSSNYDFRKTANPNDPLIHLFDEWVDYYKLKWAVSQVLKPNSILEIGVRFGYSALAFLEAHPTAHYVGIDLDTDSFGGTQGAINWAKEKTRSFLAEFIVADTQAMSQLPGNIYDLIHVDGQQDGDSSFHDLKMAIRQGRYVLVDGFFWANQNFTAISDFLFRHADLLDWYGVIPGYAGELLIKVSESNLEPSSKKNQIATTKNSSVLRQTYTNQYYTQDCGGFDSYKKTKGKRLEDPRLQAVASISGLKHSGQVLDLGCGRGELTYYFARQNYQVTAIDYSQDAIELAKACFEGELELEANVRFLCDDVCKIDLSEKYDLAVASDVIEHLSSEELDKFYQKVAEHLKQSGLFVIHTFPNLWYYKYDYARRRRIAASVGAYLPSEPRSRYELLMHINEQSPRVLKKQLGKYFKHLYLWFGDHQSAGGSLVENFSIREIAASPSLFAVASHQEIDLLQLRSRLHLSPLPPIPGDQVKLLVTDYPEVVKVNSEFEIELEIENNSNFLFHSCGAHPIHISYHWMNKDADSYLVFDGERTKLFPALEASSFQDNTSVLSAKRRTYKARVKGLSEGGVYVLVVTLVQEGVRWFDQAPTHLMCKVLIKTI